MENNTTNASVLIKDRNTHTLDLLHKMKMHGMASAFEDRLHSTVAEGMTPDGFISMLAQSERDYRSNAARERLIRNAAFRYKMYPEDINYDVDRGLDRNQMERLLTMDFARNGENLFITGPAGTGKSILSTVLGYQGCMNNIKTLYANASKLLGKLKVAKAKDCLDAEMRKIERLSYSYWMTFSSCPLMSKNVHSCLTSSRTVTAVSRLSSPRSNPLQTGMT